MEQYLNIISVPAIAAVVFAIVNLIQYAVKKEKFDRFIPLISAVLGVICGVVCFYGLPSILPAQNVIVAIVIGGASGLSATGTHQIFKQLTKTDQSGSKDADEKTDETSDNDTNSSDSNK